MQRSADVTVKRRAAPRSVVKALRRVGEQLHAAQFVPARLIHAGVADERDASLRELAPQRQLRRHRDDRRRREYPHRYIDLPAREPPVHAADLFERVVRAAEQHAVRAGASSREALLHLVEFCVRDSFYARRAHAVESAPAASGVAPSTWKSGTRPAVLSSAAEVDQSLRSRAEISAEERHVAPYLLRRGPAERRKIKFVRNIVPNLDDDPGFAVLVEQQAVARGQPDYRGTERALRRLGGSNARLRRS